MKHALSSLTDHCAQQRVSLNYGHNGGTLQTTLEGFLEKKGGSRLGAPGSKPLVFWLDNLSAPAADKYETRSSLELVRQALDYGGWYDKARATHKDIGACQFVGCMNPSAGQGPVASRLQRHFVVLSLPTPSIADTRCAVSVYERELLRLLCGLAAHACDSAL